MVSLILVNMFPVGFVIFLGWVAGRWKVLDATLTGVLAVFVVQFTLPAALFVGASRASPAQIENWKFLFGLSLGLVIIYVISLWLSVTYFDHNLAEGALQAMNCSFPNMAAMGIPILGSMFGPSSMLSVIVGNLVSSLVIVPATLTMLEVSQRGSHGGRTLGRCLLNSLQQPLVWAPVAGVVLVLVGGHLPVTADRSLELIGSVTPGVSLFSLGLLLSQQTVRLTSEVIFNVVMKVLGQPALMGLLVLLLAVPGTAGSEMIILGALPSATITPMLALRYNLYTAQSSATVLLSTVFSALTLAVVITLTAMPQ